MRQKDQSTVQRVAVGESESGGGKVSHTRCAHLVPNQHVPLRLRCRKQHGVVRKTAKGRSLKRWTKEKWKDTITKKPCGHKGHGVEYCRPSKKVSKRTPKMPRGEIRTAMPLRLFGM